MSKKIYNFDPVTFELLGSETADESPVEPGVWLIPAFATDVAPPPPLPNTVAVFSTDVKEWSLVADFRGSEYFSTATGAPASIAELGKTPEELGLTDLPPSAGPVQWVAGAWQADLVRAREVVWQLIKAERDLRIKTGGYLVAGKWYHSDTFSRTQQMGLVLLGANIPAGTLWKTMDGSFVAMTAELASQILATAAASDIAIFAAAMAHKTAMEASADPGNYDFSGGWPPTFMVGPSE